MQVKENVNLANLLLVGNQTGNSTPRPKEDTKEDFASLLTNAQYNADSKVNAAKQASVQGKEVFPEKTSTEPKRETKDFSKSPASTQTERTSSSGEPDIRETGNAAEEEAEDRIGEDSSAAIESISILLQNIMQQLQLTSGELADKLQEIGMNPMDLLTEEGLKELFLFMNSAETADLLVDEGLNLRLQSFLGELENTLQTLDTTGLDTAGLQTGEAVEDIVSDILDNLEADQEDGKTSMQSFNEQIEYLERITTNLHESVMKVRMVPIESVVNRFPRMIRDLSKKLGKEMELIMTGEDTELDRTVIDEIGDPLMHMLRNSADHGLESTIDRLKLGKPQVGTIQLNAYQDGNNVTIEVIDDGAGIDVEKVKASAVKKGHITEEQAEMMSEKEAIDLLFRPAFSTAEKISDVSGRGVGLDVVKNKIEGLGGDVEVSTKLGEGTKFTVRLPLTLAIIQALMVEVRDEKYAIPLNSIVTIEDVMVSDIKYVQQKEVINLRGTVIPLVRLDEVLDCPPREEEPENLVVVIVKKGDKQTGLVIDNLLGQQEIVIKPLGKYINIHKMISGATILGDGEVALIIDSNSLV